MQEVQSKTTTWKRKKKPNKNKIMKRVIFV